MEVGLLIVLPDQGSCSLTVNELNENKIKLFFYESYLNKSEKKIILDLGSKLKIFWNNIIWMMN